MGRPNHVPLLAGDLVLVFNVTVVIEGGVHPLHHSPLDAATPQSVWLDRLAWSLTHSLGGLG